jgi:hypothetical protein
MSAATVEKVIEIISTRRTQVLEANGFAENPEDPNNVQFAWINGIYDDLIECIKVSS